ncbi:MAG: hypothetical protein KF858_02285 [Candidatus Sumerlaeia bacterium]|nr:hypothetical protein [Candidatus Sumerlaeia bacterium]
MPCRWKKDARAGPWAVAGVLCLAAGAWAADSVWSPQVDFACFSVGDTASAAGLAGSGVANEVAQEVIAGETGTFDTAEDDVFQVALPNGPPTPTNGKAIDDGGSVPGIMPLSPLDLTIRTASESADVGALALNDPLSLDIPEMIAMAIPWFVQFSVDTAALGVPGPFPPNVATEAALGEASGDVFESARTGTNTLLVDEGALGLATSDDLDGLILNEPFPFTGVIIDTDGDGSPDMPMVFFCLRPGAPGGLPSSVSSGADICVPGAGALAVPAPDPVVAFSYSTLGLVVNDVIDALYVDLASATSPYNVMGYAVASLAPGSPSLSTIPATPGDLLLLDLGGTAAPTVIASHVTLGLAATDNLNALWLTAMPLEAATVAVELDLFHID